MAAEKVSPSGRTDHNRIENDGWYLGETPILENTTESRQNERTGRDGGVREKGS